MRGSRDFYADNLLILLKLLRDNLQGKNALLHTRENSLTCLFPDNMATYGIIFYL